MNFNRDKSEFKAVYGSWKDVLHPIMSIHKRLQFYISSERKQASSVQCPVRDSFYDMRLSNVLTAHLNMGGVGIHVDRRPVLLGVCVLQCLLSRSMDNGSLCVTNCTHSS